MNNFILSDDEGHSKYIKYEKKSRKLKNNYLKKEDSNIISLIKNFGKMDKNQINFLLSNSPASLKKEETESKIKTDFSMNLQNESKLKNDNDKLINIKQRYLIDNKNTISKKDGMSESIESHKLNILDIIYEQNKDVNNLYHKGNEYLTNNTISSNACQNLTTNSTKDPKSTTKRINEKLLKIEEIDNISNLIYQKQYEYTNYTIQQNKKNLPLLNTNEIKQKNWKKIILNEVGPNENLTNIINSIVRHVEIRNSKNKLISKQIINNLLSQEVNKIYSLNEMENLKTISLYRDTNNTLGRYTLPEINNHKITGEIKTSLRNILEEDEDYQVTINRHNLNGIEEEYTNTYTNEEFSRQRNLGKFITPDKIGYDDVFNQFINKKDKIAKNIIINNTKKSLILIQYEKDESMESKLFSSKRRKVTEPNSENSLNFRNKLLIESFDNNNSKINHKKQIYSKGDFSHSRSMDLDSLIYDNEHKKCKQIDNKNLNTNIDKNNMVIDSKSNLKIDKFNFSDLDNLDKDGDKKTILTDTLEDFDNFSLKSAYLTEYAKGFSKTNKTLKEFENNKINSFYFEQIDKTNKKFYGTACEFSKRKTRSKFKLCLNELDPNLIYNSTVKSKQNFKSKDNVNNFDIRDKNKTNETQIKKKAIMKIKSKGKSKKNLVKDNTVNKKLNVNKSSIEPKNPITKSSVKKLSTKNFLRTETNTIESKTNTITSDLNVRDISKKDTIISRDDSKEKTKNDIFSIATGSKEKKSKKKGKKSKKTGKKNKNTDNISITDHSENTLINNLKQNKDFLDKDIISISNKDIISISNKNRNSISKNNLISLNNKNVISIGYKETSDVTKKIQFNNLNLENLNSRSTRKLPNILNKIDEINCTPNNFNQRFRNIILIENNTDRLNANSIGLSKNSSISSTITVNVNNQSSNKFCLNALDLLTDNKIKNENIFNLNESGNSSMRILTSKIVQKTIKEENIEFEKKDNKLENKVDFSSNSTINQVVPKISLQSTESMLKEIKKLITSVRKKEFTDTPEMKKEDVDLEIESLIKANKVESLHKNLDFDLLIKNNIINRTHKDLLTNLMKSNMNDKDVVFQILELIKMQENIKSRRTKRKIRLNAIEKENNSKNKKDIILKPIVNSDNQKNPTLKFLDESFNLDPELQKMLKKKREQAILYDIDININMLILESQTEEEKRRYQELVERMQSMKNYNAENYVRNITELYQDFKSEQREIRTILHKEERMNYFMEQLNNFRESNKCAKEILSSNFKFKNVLPAMKIGPLFK